jgi:hypothetical protein
MKPDASWWLVFESLEDDAPETFRPWPDNIIEDYRRQFQAQQGDFWFSADDPAVIGFVSRYRQAFGYEPFSYRVAKVKRGREAEHAFYLLPHPKKEVRIADGLGYFQEQLDCGNPVPEFLKRSGQGCGLGKLQISPLRLEPGARLPKDDFFYLDAGARLPYMTFGVSPPVRDALLAAKVTGCEIGPILGESGDRESGAYQLTITGSTEGALDLGVAPPPTMRCGVCGHWFLASFPGLDPGKRIYDRTFFSDLDLQLGDRLAIPGKGVIVGSCAYPPIFASGRLIALIQQNEFKGLNRSAPKARFWPVTIEE